MMAAEIKKLFQTKQCTTCVVANLQINFAPVNLGSLVSIILHFIQSTNECVKLKLYTVNHLLRMGAYLF